MSIKRLSDIITYKQTKHLYSDEERKLLIRELRKRLNIGLETVSETVIQIIDKINED